MRFNLPQIILLASLGTKISAHGGHHVCSFVPSYVFENILASEDASEDLRASANHTLMHLREIHAHRMMQGGEGYSGADDDSYFDEDQNPDGQGELDREAQELDQADQGEPDDDYVVGATNPEVPNYPYSTDGSTKRARRMKRKVDLTGAYRYIFNGGNSWDRTSPGVLVRSEAKGGPAQDRAANVVYDNLGYVHNLFFQVYGRAVLTGRNVLEARIHHGVRYDNAIWDGVRMIFGDGNLATTCCYEQSLSVIAHEVTHGVIQASGGLRYYGESGALNEHIADVFSTLTEQYARRDTAASASWVVGLGILKGGAPFRSLRRPGSAFNVPGYGHDQQVSHYANYVRTTADDGGVHINSGIPNYAFFRFATRVGGYAWEVPGKIWYSVLVSRRLSYAGETFPSFAQKTVDAALNMYNVNVANALKDAWAEAGITTRVSTG